MNEEKILSKELISAAIETGRAGKWYVFKIVEGDENVQSMY